MLAGRRLGSVGFAHHHMNLVKLKKSSGLTWAQRRHSGLWMKAVSASLLRTMFRSVPHKREVSCSRWGKHWGNAGYNWSYGLILQ